jgi:hypothetical protein
MLMCIKFYQYLSIQCCSVFPEQKGGHDEDKCCTFHVNPSRPKSELIILFQSVAAAGVF